MMKASQMMGYTMCTAHAQIDAKSSLVKKKKKKRFSHTQRHAVRCCTLRTKPPHLFFGSDFLCSFQTAAKRVAHGVRGTRLVTGTAGEERVHDNARPRVQCVGPGRNQPDGGGTGSAPNGGLCCGFIMVQTCYFAVEVHCDIANRCA